MITVTRETHECPETIQHRLTLAGGLNRFGDPNYRFVWSGSRLMWLGGMWWDGKFEKRQVPKHLPPWERWVMERYCPPEFYGPRWIWEARNRVAYGSQSLQMMDYPSRGDYEHSETLDMVCNQCLAEYKTGKNRKAIGECQHRTFLQLSTRVADMLCGMVRLSRNANEQEITNACKREVEREAKLTEQECLDIIEGRDRTISKPRADYIDRAIVPEMEKLLKSSQKRLSEGRTSQGGKVSAFVN